VVVSTLGSAIPVIPGLFAFMFINGIPLLVPENIAAVKSKIK
jgi:hypothetical protein